VQHVQDPTPKIKRPIWNRQQSSFLLKIEASRIGMETFVSHNDQEFGPFSLADIRAKIEAGDLSTRDNARIAGLSDWKWIRLHDLLSAAFLLETAYALHYRASDVESAIQVYNDILSTHPETQEAYWAKEQLGMIKRITPSERRHLKEQFEAGKRAQAEALRRQREAAERAQAENLRRQREAAERTKAEADKRREKAERAKAEAENLRRQREAAEQEKSVKLIVECPACAAELRLPHERGKLKVTCPKCKDTFEVRLTVSGHVHIYQRAPDIPPGHFKDEDDPYVVLQLAPRATVQEIKSAFRKRMQEYHPDRVASLGIHLRAVAEEETKRINRAYELLLTERYRNSAK